MTVTTAADAASVLLQQQLWCQLPLIAAVICFLLRVAGNPADVSACNASPQQQQWLRPEGTLLLTPAGAIAAAARMELTRFLRTNACCDTYHVTAYHLQG